MHNDIIMHDKKWGNNNSNKKSMSHRPIVMILIKKTGAVARTEVVMPVFRDLKLI